MPTWFVDDLIRVGKGIPGSFGIHFRLDATYPVGAEKNPDAKFVRQYI